MDFFDFPENFAKKQKQKHYATMLGTDGFFMQSCRSCFAYSLEEAARILRVDIGYVDLYEVLKHN
jgi:hypothetical protein